MDNELSIVIGAVLDDSAKGGLEEQLKTLGISAEVSATLAKGAIDTLKKDLPELDIEANISSASRQTIAKYLDGLKNKSFSIDVQFSDAQLGKLETTLNRFAEGIGNKIATNIAKAIGNKDVAKVTQVASPSPKQSKTNTSREIKEIAEVASKIGTLSEKLSALKKTTKDATVASLAGEEMKTLSGAKDSGDAAQMTKAYQSAAQALEYLTAQSKAYTATQDEIAAAQKRVSNELEKARALRASTQSGAIKREAQILVGWLDEVKGSPSLEELNQAFESMSPRIKQLNEDAKQYSTTLAQMSHMSQSLDTNIDKANDIGGKSGDERVSKLAKEYIESAKALKENIDANTKAGASFDSLQKEIEETREKYDALLFAQKKYKDQTQAQQLAANKKSFITEATEYKNKNTKIASSDAYSGELNRIIAAAEKADKISLQKLRSEFTSLKKNVQAAGLEAESASSKFGNMFKKFAGWFGVSQVVMGVVNAIKRYSAQLVEVDTYLTEISKTSNRTKAQLQDLGAASFGAAKQYGSTIQGYLSGVQEMSRAGYNDVGKAESLAELSILTQSAGDTTAEVANKFIIATDASYKLNGSISALSDVIDGANGIKKSCP